MIKSEDNKAYSENAIVYQISNLARNWQLSNPFFISLRGLLLDEKFSLGKLRLQQEYGTYFTGTKQQVGHKILKRFGKEVIN